jgi:hypothetical protein
MYRIQANKKATPKGRCYSGAECCRSAWLSSARYLVYHIQGALNRPLKENPIPRIVLLILCLCLVVSCRGTPALTS